jgi:hypothetical protein
MILHKVLRRGSDHPDFCQDFYAIGETSNFLYCCIFDGCSGGKDSHFASTLFGKTFKDVITNLSDFLDKPESTTENNSKFLMYMMSRKISEVKQILHLDIVELLSTVVLCAINKNTKECLITAFGDGFFCVDGQETLIKNTRFLNKENGENMPDYLVYDLKDIENYGDFENWFDSKSEKHLFESVKEVSIASDGIATFKQFKHSDFIINPIDFLAKDDGLMNTKNMLERKYNILQNKYCMINTDDLSLIRIKFD